MRAAAVVLALAGIALLAWWLRDDATSRAERAQHEAPAESAASERRHGSPPERTARAPNTASIEVLIRRPDDTGVKGVTVRLVEDREVARAVTGEDGVARFPEAPAMRMEVWALRRRLGSVSPAEGERRLEYTIEELLELVVHVTCDGEPRLPDGLRVADPPLVGPVYDTERAEVRGRFLPPADQTSFSVSVRAPGYTGGSVIRTVARNGGEVRAEAKLRRTRRVTIDVEGPTWTLGLLELEEPDVRGYENTAGEWKRIESGNWIGARPPRRVLLATSQIRYDVRPGRYRVRLRDTPAVVVPEFVVDREDLRFDADLTNAGRQEIVLRAPAEVSMREATVQAGPRTVKPSAHGSGYARFSIVLDGGHQVVLEPRHPLLEPVDPLHLVAAAAEIAVDMRLRPLVRFRLPEEATRAVLLRRLRDGGLVGVAKAEPFGDGYAFAVPPARYRLRVFFKNRPPVDREIVVPEGGLDLGLITLR